MFLGHRFAIMWTPIYRIPDHPLSSKFLTYHKLTPQPVSQTHHGLDLSGLEPAQPTQHGISNDTEQGRLCLPVVGLMVGDQRGEAWFEPYDECPIARQIWQARPYSRTLFCYTRAITICFNAVYTHRETIDAPGKQIVYPELPGFGKLNDYLDLNFQICKLLPFLKLFINVVLDDKNRQVTMMIS